jgi:hypothetical protein
MAQKPMGKESVKHQGCRNSPPKNALIIVQKALGEPFRDILPLSAALLL